MKTLLGSELSPQAQQDALARFVHRHTRTNRRAHHAGCALQFDSDTDWLAHTLFYVTQAGRLSNRHRFCESSPTWPDNPELRRALRKLDALPDGPFTAQDIGA